MKYESKKDPQITAALDFENEKFKTVRMIYLTGKDAGKSFDITTSTLKRWWKPVKATEAEIEQEIINTPYPEPEHQEYIPKPQSVIEYEEAKRTRTNKNLPEWEDMRETLAEYCTKINDNSKYLKLFDKVSTVWRKSQAIDMYTTEELFVKFAENGFQSKPNKDKQRPVHIQIKTMDEYETFVELIKTFDN